MTASRIIEVSPGIAWETMSDGCLDNGPIVCVPIKDILVMTDEQVGMLARRAVWTAKVAVACMLASNVIYQSSLTRKPGDILKYFAWKDLSLLQEFIGEDKSIDQAISILTAAIAEQGQAEYRAKAKRVLRTEIASGYDKLFVAIGRRDGFHCAICDDAGSDLQIDHVIPVSRGGSNDLENLQLLCKTCNIVKGAKV